MIGLLVLVLGFVTVDQYVLEDTSGDGAKVAKIDLTEI